MGYNNVRPLTSTGRASQNLDVAVNLLMNAPKVSDETSAARGMAITKIQEAMMAVTHLQNLYIQDPRATLSDLDSVR